MNKFSTRFFAVLTVALVLLCGCKENVDLAHIDRKIEANLGLALPIGTLRFSIGDFLGNGEVKQLFIDDDGILNYRDTFSVTRNFHEIDLKKYVSETTKNFDVYSEMRKDYEPGEGGRIIVLEDKPVSKTMQFPLTLTMEGMNKPDIKDERIDSVSVTSATFYSKIERVDFSLNWNQVDSVKVILGKEFTRKGGNLVTIYNRKKAFPKPINEWGEEIPVTVDNFTLCLMKDRWTGVSGKTFEEYLQNVMDSCHFEFQFYFTIPAGQIVTFESTAKYKYNFKVDLVEYEAAWGYFKPSNQMKDDQIINIEDEWPNWQYFKNATLPFVRPRMNLTASTQVAAALIMTGDYLFVQNQSEGKTIYATFDENQQKRERVLTWDSIGYLPLDSKIGDSITYHIQFSKNWWEGHIDRMFSIKPVEMGYKYHIDIDTVKTPQSRVNYGGTDIDLQAVITLPFDFNNGLSIDYTDTVQNVNISSWSLDSLLAEVKAIDTVKSTNLRLVLTANNTLPMCIKGVPTFLDDNGDVLMDPNDPLVPLRFSETDTLYFKAPMVEDGRVTEPGVSTFVLSIDKKHFDQFATIKKIRMHALADNASLIKGGVITDQSSLKLKMGIAAHVDAIINLENSNK